MAPDALNRIVADLGALTAACDGSGASGGVSVVAWDAAASRARSRVFAVGAGVAEDPATGSAALALGAWLVACGLVAADGTTDYEVVQGVELGRPSLLSGTVEAAGAKAISCQVSGQVVPIAAGRIRSP